MDASNAADVPHFGSVSTIQIARIVLEAVLFALVHDCDVSSSVRILIKEVFRVDISLVTCTNSRRVYGSLVSLNTACRIKDAVPSCTRKESPRLESGRRCNR